MARAVKFNPSFFDWLGNQPGVVAATKAAADRVASVAKSTAPVGTAPGDKHPGKYRDSIKVTKSERGGRVTYRVGSDVDYALAVEARTGNLAKASKKAKT
jgi:lipoate-protein ligase B